MPRARAVGQLQWLSDLVTEQGLIILNLEQRSIFHKNRFAAQLFDTIGHAEILPHLFGATISDEERVLSFHVPGSTFPERHLGWNSVELGLRVREVPGVAGVAIATLRPVPDRATMVGRLAEYQYLVETLKVGSALFEVDLKTETSHAILCSDRYTQLMGVERAELERVGVKAVRPVIHPADRAKHDGVMEDAIRNHRSHSGPFRVTNDQWRFFVATWKSDSLDRVFLSIAIADFTEAAVEKRLAHSALSASLSLSCLMQELFTVTFHMDEDLNVLDDTAAVRRFFGITASVAMLNIAPAEETRKAIASYLQTRPGTGRDAQSLPSVISVPLQSGSGLRTAHMFAYAAFPDAADPLPTPLMDSLVGPSPVSPRQFLVAVRWQDSEPEITRSPTPVGPSRHTPHVTEAGDRAVRRLVLEALSKIPNAPVRELHELPIKWILPAYTVSDFEAVREELLMSLPLRDAHILDFGDIDECIEMLQAAETPDWLKFRFLLGLVAQNQTEDFLRHVSCLVELAGDRPAARLELALVVTSEAVACPSAFTGERLSMVRSVFMRALQPGVIDNGFLQPGVHFLTILFACFSHLTGRDGDARELLTGSLDDLELLLVQRGYMPSLWQLSMVASHNLALDAWTRGDTIGTFKSVFHLQRAAKAAPLLSPCQQLLAWAVSVHRFVPPKSYQ